jgi:hypothetical protein
MKIAMLTSYDKKIEEYAIIGAKNKQAYCDKHNIPFICETSIFPPDGAMWGKLLVLVRHLPNYDWIFWTDADSLIMNSEILPVPPETTKDMIISYDRWTLNAGQFWIRNCPWSYDFLIRAYCCRNGWFDGDNGSIMQLFEDCPKDWARFEVVSQRLFNSYKHNGTYHEGDFMIHFAGQGGKKDLMTTWAKKAV